MKHTHFKSWFTLMIGCLFFMNVQPLLASGDYLTGLPFIAGANTVVYNGNIEIYPKSLKDQYNFVYQTVGLPLVYDLPIEDEPGPVDGGGIIEDTYDSLLKIKKPIILITE